MRTVLVAAVVVLLAAPIADAQRVPVTPVDIVAARWNSPAPFVSVTLRSGAVLMVSAEDMSDNGTGLRVSSTEPTCIDAARLTLASGLRVFVPLVDLEEATIPRRSPAECANSAALSTAGTATTSSVPSDAAALASIRAQCAKEWGNDFKMRNYCEEQQLEALRKLRSR